MQYTMWKIYTAIIGTASTFVAQKLVSKGWEIATGEEPPEPGDPDVPLHLAVTWAIASGVGVGVVQLLTNRATMKRMRTALDDEGIKGKPINLKI